RPILAENCHRCHGEKKQNGKLRLDSAATLLAGGESGPALVPGDPEKSLLIEAINYGSLEMPPDGRLRPEQIKLLTEWVKIGAPWPGSGEQILQPRKAGFVITDADRQHWSFQPVRRPKVGDSGPESPGAELAHNPIDIFIRERLAEKGLHPSQQAQKHHLIRRLAFDITGLPPSAADVTAFAADMRPDAYERVVDRLLASPQYGERWARHWLDIVRFAQSNGYERDSEKPLAWRYRDYVIRALNEDKPYDQFLIEQLAGDELEPLTDDSLSATGYYRLGVWDDEPDDGKQAKADELDDIVSTTASAMLGLTLGCARCHDHKFDPVSQEDYYSFTAFMQNIHLYGKVADVISGGQPVDKEGIFRKLPSGGGETLCVREHDNPPPQSFVFIRGNAHTPGRQVEPRFIEVLCQSKTEDSKGSKEDSEKANSLLPLLPSVPSSSSPFPLLPPVQSPPASSHGRRLSLARWIASRENPLTARVAVNRLWQHHFGRGIVSTPGDFGHTGNKPTHPELLDYLASELIDGDWQIKRLQRAIVTSATYRQASAISEFKIQNSKFKVNAVQSTLNLEPGAWNPSSIDHAILAASGELNSQMGGRGLFPTLPPEVLAKQSRPGNGWDKSPPDQQARRSVYIFVKRTLGVPLLESFDQANADSPIAQRNITTVAPQALILLNSDFMNQQAAALARRTKAAACCDPYARIEALYEYALGRGPTDREIDVALRFLQHWNDQDDRTIAELCKIILNLNEFVYVD
ncbi:MAG: PSD1 domain-containing protein, partial [Planctomycetia bacterium]|nr:PSD1 domain-containing protein [Planctomycetia bacterium]